MAQDHSNSERTKFLLHGLRVRGAFKYSNTWTPHPRPVKSESLEMGGFKRSPGDSNVQLGLRVGALDQSCSYFNVSPSHWGLVKMSSDAAALGWGPKFCVTNKLPGEADAAVQCRPTCMSPVA